MRKVITGEPAPAGGELGQQFGFQRFHAPIDLEENRAKRSGFGRRVLGHLARGAHGFDHARRERGADVGGWVVWLTPVAARACGRSPNSLAPASN